MDVCINYGADVQTLERAEQQVQNAARLYTDEFFPAYCQLCADLQLLFDQEEQTCKVQAVASLCEQINIPHEHNVSEALQHLQVLRQTVSSSDEKLKVLKARLSGLVAPVYNEEHRMIEDYTRLSAQDVHTQGPNANNRFSGSDVSLPRVVIDHVKLFDQLAAKQTMPKLPHRSPRRLAPPPFGLMNLAYRKAKMTLTGPAAYAHGCCISDENDCTIEVLIRRAELRNTCQAILLTPLVRAMPSFSRCIDANSNTVRKLTVDDSQCAQLPRAFSAKKVQSGCWCVEIPSQTAEGYVVDQRSFSDLKQSIKYALENSAEVFGQKQLLYITINSFVDGSCKGSYLPSAIAGLRTWWDRAVFAVTQLFNNGVTAEQVPRHVEVMGEPLRSYCSQLLSLEPTLAAPQFLKLYQAPTQKLSDAQHHSLIRAYLCRLCGAHVKYADTQDEMLLKYGFELGITVSSTKKVATTASETHRPLKKPRVEFVRTNAVTGVNPCNPCAISGSRYKKRKPRKHADFNFFIEADECSTATKTKSVVDLAEGLALMCGERPADPQHASDTSSSDDEYVSEDDDLEWY